MKYQVFIIKITDAIFYKKHSLPDAMLNLNWLFSPLSLSIARIRMTDDPRAAVSYTWHSNDAAENSGWWSFSSWTRMTTRAKLRLEGVPLSRTMTVSMCFLMDSWSRERAMESFPEKESILKTLRLWGLALENKMKMSKTDISKIKCYIEL